jgi:hypothetical protein
MGPKHVSSSDVREWSLAGPCILTNERWGHSLIHNEFNGPRLTQHPY